MYISFSKLQDRTLNSLSKTDLVKIKNILSEIQEPTLVSGTGGSFVVSLFLSKVLSTKNNIICNTTTARDMQYQNIDNYKNIIACSYSGNNLGCNLSFNNKLNKYLLSKNEKENVTNIKYIIEDEEYSFISLSQTLIPMTIILAYYLDNDLSKIKEILDIIPNFNIKSNKIYEVLSGYDTLTASKFIESTLIEAGIGIPIIHDKYDYCHGRTNLNYNFNNALIFFDTDKELDKLYAKELPNYYEDIIRIPKKYSDDIINDYYLTYISMYLCKSIAELQNKDLSLVNYSPLVKKLYHYKGEV